MRKETQFGGSKLVRGHYPCMYVKEVGKANHKSQYLSGEKLSHHNLYGATEAIIVRGQSQAKLRVIIFLTTFLISGFFSKCVLLVLQHHLQHE